jgi:hypothetical protein
VSLVSARAGADTSHSHTTDRIDDINETTSLRSQSTVLKDGITLIEIVAKHEKDLSGSVADHGSTELVDIETTYPAHLLGHSGTLDNIAPSGLGDLFPSHFTGERSTGSSNTDGHGTGGVPNRDLATNGGNPSLRHHGSDTDVGRGDLGPRTMEHGKTTSLSALKEDTVTVVQNLSGVSSLPRTSETARSNSTRRKTTMPV